MDCRDFGQKAGSRSRRILHRHVGRRRSLNGPRRDRHAPRRLRREEGGLATGSVLTTAGVYRPHDYQKRVGRSWALAWLRRCPPTHKLRGPPGLAKDSRREENVYQPPMKSAQVHLRERGFQRGEVGARAKLARYRNPSPSVSCVA